MDRYRQLPVDVDLLLAGEFKEFIVYPVKKYPLKISLSLLAFGIFLMLFISIFAIVFIGGFLNNNPFSSESTDILSFKGIIDVAFSIFPLLIISIFFLIGIGLFLFAINSFFAKGDLYIGTPKRLVIYNKKKVRSVSWSELSSDIELKGNANKGSLILKLNTGRTLSTKSESKAIIPEIIQLANIDRPNEIMQKIRRNIENQIK